ncbi:MarR family winged helix-turn-helix transcriptional regulator [Dictyobacter kobayashii]|uniref:Transcriptional regulator n=1 Tax=Dictyobacter kobayashii TaxID=2014872 RepID=A0A402AN07_9CHLR|nr:MarR family transcriptional regulator [Dictyobacter kobayashii]GCE20533.1 transcriptional regulator [Dictyobacter kobayashii]
MFIQDEAKAQRLLRSFMQFDKAEWHERSIEGCKPSEIKVLLCIKRHMKLTSHEMKVSEISRLLHVTSPGVTQLLKGLEADGLIERKIDHLDRRAVGIALTKKGEQIADKAIEALFTSFNGLIDYLGEEQSNQLAELLTKVYTYFNEREASMLQAYRRGDEEA